MRACGGNFQRALRASLPAHVGEIRAVRRRRRQRPAGREFEARAAAQSVADAGQRRCRRDARTARDARLFGIRGRHDEPAPIAHGVHRGRERAAHRAQFAGKRKLAVELGVVEARRGKLSRCRQDAERHREVVTPALLRQVRRREVDRHAAGREFEAALRERRPDPLSALAHGGFGEADHGELRQARAAVHLDAHERRFERELRTGQERWRASRAAARAGYFLSGPCSSAAMRRSSSSSRSRLRRRTAAWISNSWRVTRSSFARPLCSTALEVALEVVAERREPGRHGVRQLAREFFEGFRVECQGVAPAAASGREARTSSNAPVRGRLRPLLHRTGATGAPAAADLIPKPLNCTISAAGTLAALPAQTVAVTGGARRARVWPVRRNFAWRGGLTCRTPFPRSTVATLPG